jgi:hypothetical protein
MAKHYKQFKLNPYLCVLRVYIDLDAFDKDTGANCRGDLLQAATFRCADYFAVYIPASERGMVNIRTAAHEAYHVADFVMERVGMEYKHNSCNEHVAYLVGYVCECLADGANWLTAKKAEAPK